MGTLHNNIRLHSILEGTNMTRHDDALNDLKSRLEGKRVLKVEPSNDPEGIAKFHLDNGSVFHLCATELGFWIDDAPGSDGLCKSLTTWFDEYYKYASREGYADHAPTIIHTDDQKLVMIAMDGETDMLDIASLPELERDFVNTTDLNDLAQIATMGDCWSMCVDDVDGKLVIKDNWKAGWCVDDKS